MALPNTESTAEFDDEQGSYRNRLDHAEAQVEHLRIALVTSRRIAAAVGILMARRGLTYDTAFELLRARSQERNRKLAAVAEDVLLEGDLS